MYKYIKTLIVSLLILSSFTIKVEAAEITDINDLIENAKELDGQEVTVQGEAIGESMNRGDYSWININDGTNAIGIWLLKEEAEKLSYFGNYKYRGDAVKITGIFHRACKEHGGEADLHYSSIEILKDGYLVTEPISSTKLIVTIILTTSSLIYVFFFIKNTKSGSDN